MWGLEQASSKAREESHRLQNSPAEASPSETVISTVLWDSEAQIEDSQWACLEKLVDHRGLSEHLSRPVPSLSKQRGLPLTASQNWRCCVTAQCIIIPSC